MTRFSIALAAAALLVLSKLGYLYVIYNRYYWRLYT
jgi:hypothetical protein